jgi:hypothetical protein
MTVEEARQIVDGIDRIWDTTVAAGTGAPPS